MERTTTLRFTPRFVVGLTVLWIGIFWLLDELGQHQVHILLDLWPAGLILLAIAIALNGGGWLSTFLVGGVGVWLLGDSLDLFDLDLGDLWPLVLVLIGFRLIMKGAGVDTGSSGPAGRSSGVAIFGDRRHVISGSTVSRLNATAVLGSSTVDLTGANFPDGAGIEVFCLAGGIDLVVSPDTRIVSDVVPVMAGYDDKRTTNVVPTQTLHVRGLCIWGAVEITSGEAATDHGTEIEGDQS